MMHVTTTVGIASISAVKRYSSPLPLTEATRSSPKPRYQLPRIALTRPPTAKPEGCTQRVENIMDWPLEQTGDSTWYGLIAEKGSTSCVRKPSASMDRYAPRGKWLPPNTRLKLTALILKDAVCL